jgi:DNA-binding IclR family transcriptional regulator
MTHDSDQAESPRTLKTVERTAQIIKALETLDGAGVTELATYLDMSKSSTYHYLATLREEEFVVKTDEKYELSLRLLLSGEYVRNRNILYRYGKEEVEPTRGDDWRVCQSFYRRARQMNQSVQSPGK